MEQSIAQPLASIHPDTHIGLVTLRVSNLDRALKFYEEILGFQHSGRNQIKLLVSEIVYIFLNFINNLKNAKYALYRRC